MWTFLHVGKCETDVHHVRHEFWGEMQFGVVVR